MICHDLSPGNLNVPSENVEAVLAAMEKLNCSSRSLLETWRSTPGSPEFVSMVQVSAAESQGVRGRGWPLLCLGHTHTLPISNDGKGNTQRALDSLMGF